VLSNLLRNAAKYTNTGGRIVVGIDRGPLTVALRVSDNGIGIENDALAYVFDLFSQVRPSQVTGLGIGLSIVREIVAMHGGDIQAHSKGAGLGSEFVVTLPLASPPTYDPDD
jgi:signal transduction histidine kinase